MFKQIKKEKEPGDLKETSVDFVADRLLFGSSYLHDMLTDNTP